MTTPPAALDVLQALLRCPSVTPAEGGALDVLQRLLEPAGFAVHRVTFSEPGTPDVENLYARLGTAAPHLVFAGHTDVVPPGDADAWRFPPFSGTVEDGMVWGRGACDMKGGIAAAVAAALDHVARHGAPQGSVSFLITGDEEGPAVNGHRQAARLGPGAGRALRRLHPGRAHQPGAPRRDDQDRPARIAHGRDRRGGAPGPRRLSGARRQPHPPPDAGAPGPQGRAARCRDGAFRSVETSKS